jgi:hypothetical protein
MIGASDLQTYQEQGYLVVSGLFSSAEVQHFIQHYMAMRERESAAQNQFLCFVFSSTSEKRST